MARTKTTPPSAPPPAAEPVPASLTSGWTRLDVGIVLAVVVVTAAVFANGMQGAFVYDDTKQIVANPLIQQNQFSWKAITSDVWAFKGDRSQPWSNYWRPAFIGWLMVNYRLFGLENVLGWHIANLVLHLLVVAVAFGLLRRLEVARPLAAAIVLLFAIHPVHVESVTWISGAPNPLSAVALLGALWCVVEHQSRPDLKKQIVAGALLAFSLLAKETGVVFPVLVFWLVFQRSAIDRGSLSARAARAVRAAAPFLGVTVVYLVVRMLVLGSHQSRGDWYLSLGEMVTTLPSVGAFYIRQIVFPYWLASSYPLRPVVFSRLGFFELMIPILITGATASFLYWAGRRNPLAGLGVALFVLTLAPALNIAVFFQEQIVHDRYLYVPLLGMLLVVIPLVSQGLERRFNFPPLRAQMTCLVLAGLCAVPLAVKTIRYNPVWGNEFVLFEQALTIDPESTLILTKHGHNLRRAGRLDEAKAVLERVRTIQPVPDALVNLGMIAIQQGRLVEAERDLRQAVQESSTNIAAVDQLVVCLQKQGKLNEAAAVLAQARQAMPYLKCRFTANLGSILYQAGHKDEALRELEAVRGEVETEVNPDGRLVYYLLAGLYREMGRTPQARSLLEQYLASTAGFHDSQTEATRAKAQSALQNWK